MLESCPQKSKKNLGMFGVLFLSCYYWVVFFVVFTTLCLHVGIVACFNVSMRNRLQPPAQSNQ